MNARYQSGLSLISVVIVGGLIAFAILIGFRTVPAVNEYMAIDRIIGVLAKEGDNGKPIIELRRDFDRRREIDDIRSVTGADLEISKEDNRTIIGVEYERKVPVVANVSLLIEFNASSRGR
ncbi:MAG: DUF4845 domain-containing protein [Proteobacteria bacterium]|nr:DUF4845 domain-containing protein [Pseudomonadota bacterium]MBS0553303.1 DUF4845 domain-containing protein [Pseudomonadota bacterium]